MDPKIEWSEAEGNPYMPSGQAWLGPDAVLNNLFLRLGTDWDGFAVHPAAYHDVATRSSWRHATAEPIRRRAKK